MLTFAFFLFLLFLDHVLGLVRIVIHVNEVIFAWNLLEVFPVLPRVSRLVLELVSKDHFGFVQVAGVISQR